jgi:carboxymethylenebutenolidase
MMDHIAVNGHDGTFFAYIARPKTSPASAVVVLQELFGVNTDIRKHCDELAKQGYLAVAPDLYWRQEPGVDLNVIGCCGRGLLETSVSGTNRFSASDRR